jgi:hypothetical protein
VTKDIVQMSMTCWASSENPKDWQLQYSDDASSWTTLFSISGETGWSAGETRAYDNGARATVFFLDLEGGNDSKDGTSYPNRWKTLTSGATAVRIGPGNTIRVMASSDPTSMGQNATWTNNSATVTLASAVNALIHSCDSAWVGSTNVTQSADTSTYKSGTGAAKSVIASAFTTGKIAYARRADDGTDAGAHRYWRIRITASGNGADTGMAECELRTSAGGSDVTGSGTTIFSTQLNTSSFAAANAFDNNTSTNWCSNGFGTSGGEWIGYDFGAGNTFNIKEVAFSCRSDFTPDAPKDFTIEFSDDNSTWFSSWSVTGQTGWSAGVTRTFTKPTTSNIVTDLSAYQGVTLWVRSTATLSAGVLSLRLCSDATGDTTVNICTLPAITAVNQWQAVTVQLGTSLGSSINSVALYAESDPGTPTVFIDNINSVKAASAADSLNLHSLIAKPSAIQWQASTSYSSGDKRRPAAASARTGLCYVVTTAGTSGSSEPTWPDAIGATVTDGSVLWTASEVEETWYCLRSINGTTLTLDGPPNIQQGSTASRGYQGATETVAAYKREPILAAPISDDSAVQAVNDAGTFAGGFITFSGGWDRTNMSSQSGDTWYSGVNGNGVAFHCGSNTWLEFINLAVTRFYDGWYCSNGTDQPFKFTNCHANACENLGLETAVGPHRVFAKNLHLTMSGYGTHIVGQALMEFRRSRIEGNNNDGILAASFANVLRMEDCYVRGNGHYGYNSQNQVGPDTRMYGCKFANNASADLYDMAGTVKLHNTDLASTTKVAASPYQRAVTRAGKLGQTTDIHEHFFKFGRILSDTSTRHTASGVAWKFQPTDTVCDLYNPMVLAVGRLALDSGVTKTISIWTRRDNANICGRLRVRGGQVAGIGESVVDCQPTINTWVQSSTISVTTSEAGVLEIEFLVWDGVGTSNSFWVDDLTVV